MKEIILFGANCGKCKKVEKRILKITSQISEPFVFKKSEDLELMSTYQVMYLPSVMIDKKFHFKGVVPSEKQLLKALTEENLKKMEKQTLVKEICPTTAQKWIKAGALLVDVREKDEIETVAFDVPKIINIPLSDFENRFNEIPKDQPVVMACKSGGRSLRAAGFLVNHGYENVVNMKFGIIRWAEKGFPTKGDIGTVLSNNSDCCSSTGCC